MDVQTARTLVASLLAATNNRALAWKENAGKNGYLCRYQSWTVEVRNLTARGTLPQLADALADRKYEMEIRDEKGGTIASLTETHQLFVPPGGELLRPIPKVGLEDLFSAITNRGNTEIQSLIRALEPLTKKSED